MTQSHFYLRLNRSSLPDEVGTPIEELFIEVCADGFVTREVGVDLHGEVVHRSPTDLRPYCLAGGKPIEKAPFQDELSKDLFDELWNI